MTVLSIVTISYNQAEYLQECIDSVVDGHECELQYIVVDPGSEDGSRELLEENRYKINDVVLEPDDGPADGLNNGFAKARGDIFGYINADDRFVPGALDYVAAYFDAHPDVDVICGAIRIIDEQGKPSLRKRTSDRFCLADYLAGICTVGQQATFFRRSAFIAAGGFNKDNRITWDGELLVDMALAGCRFESIFKVLGDFRIYPESITGSNKFRDKQQQEFARFKREARARGLHVYTDKVQCVRRLLYKLNIFRHLGYLIVR